MSTTDLLEVRDVGQGSETLAHRSTRRTMRGDRHHLRPSQPSMSNIISYHPIVRKNLMQGSPSGHLTNSCCSPSTSAGPNSLWPNRHSSLASSLSVALGTEAPSAGGSFTLPKPAFPTPGMRARRLVSLSSRYCPVSGSNPKAFKIVFIFQVAFSDAS